MKSFLLSLVAVSVVSLGACQTSPVASYNESRTVDVAGAQSRYSAEVPAGQTSEAPYALQGTQASSYATPTGNGYQAR